MREMKTDEDVDQWIFTLSANLCNIAVNLNSRERNVLFEKPAFGLPKYFSQDEWNKHPE